MSRWHFYGRGEQLKQLEEILARDRWFFAKVTGRRRIGKTTLIQEALKTVRRDRPVFYVQIPDSESVGVVSAVNDALETFQVPSDRHPRPTTVSQMVATFEAMAQDGFVLVLDEFQYFHRKGHGEFCSLLQAAVDRLAAKADRVRGGLIVLGSIYTEMAALLEDRAAPLYNRITDDVELTHLDFAALVAILRDHADPSSERLLFLWNLFEGVPKFYRDCYEQSVLGSERSELLRRIFFESSSPLRGEAENWFLRELRGRYDVVLKFVARNPGRMHNEIVQRLRDASGEADTQIGGYLKVLIERYRLIEKKLPIFSKSESRKGRYYVTDNFLRSWLSALSGAVAATAFRPVNSLIADADRRLREAEGGALEKLVAQIYEERSRKSLGDFPLSERVRGYWNSADTEIDLVAVNEDERQIRFTSCKRTPSKLIAEANSLAGHVQRFLAKMPRFAGWKHELVGIAPDLTAEQRSILRRNSLIPQDLQDLTRGLT